MLELVTETRVDLARSGARFAEGCFETLRIQAGALRWLELHRARLAAGCDLLGLEAPPPLAALEAALAGLCAGRDRGALRLLAVDGRLLAWVEPAPEPPRGPAHLGLARTVTRWSGSPWNAVKSLAQLDNRRLRREAEARGLADAVAANEHGRLTDGWRSTLLVVRDGGLVTPPASDGALPGIARRVLLEAGLLAEAPLAWEDLRRAEAVALVSALRGLQPVVEAEGLGGFPVRHPRLAEAAARLA